ncbi:MAG: magnesium transporter CorA family protein [Acidimicrobiales bacterium]
MATNWIDLLDPDAAAIAEHWPGLESSATDLLVAPHTHDDEPRPRFEGHGSYIFGVLLVPVLVQQEDRVFYQECDVILSADRILTVRKTPPDGPPIDIEDIKHLCATRALPPGTVAYHVTDEVAEGFLDLVDALNEEIDELEDGVDDLPNARVRRRLSELRHDLLHIRRTLAPTRDAVRRIVDDRVELDEGELFPHDIELRFGDAFDKLLRASEGLETARDLIGGVRDYHQSKVANDQNEVMKRLTIVASIFLPPTFIVGLYGQNFDVLPELHWAQGYGFSWAFILVSTCGQLVYFRRKGWI